MLFRSGGGELDVGAVTIIADDTSNALLIKATPGDYAKIEQLLRRLDLLPLQVLVETSIVDVGLTGDFSFGVEWFFKNNLDSKRGIGRLDTGGGGIGAIVHDPAVRLEVGTVLARASIELPGHAPVLASIEVRHVGKVTRAGGVGRRPRMERAWTLFPEPDSPTMASVSPRATSKLTLLTALTVPP